MLFAGSCLVLKGNGADVAQHCVPPVNARRMSITLRRYTWTAIMHLAIVSGFVPSSDCLATMMSPLSIAVARSCSKSHVSLELVGSHMCAQTSTLVVLIGVQDARCPCQAGSGHGRKDADRKSVV